MTTVRMKERVSRLSYHYYDTAAAAVRPNVTRVSAEALFSSVRDPIVRWSCQRAGLGQNGGLVLPGPRPPVPKRKGTLKPLVGSLSRRAGSDASQ